MALIQSFVVVHGFQSHRISAGSVIRASASTRAATKEPALIVFDLDNTLWTPELYQLRKLQRMDQCPTAGKDVKLFAGAQYALDAIRSGQFANTKFAVASRTKSVGWAHSLLDQFGIYELLDFVEIFPGHKKAHFKKIAEASGVDYADMLFFDDARDGKYGNCLPVSQMGVLSVHCPGGLDTKDLFMNGIKRFEEWDGNPGTIVEWDGSVTNTATAARTKGRVEGMVKMVNAEKRYGFITYGDSKTRDLFFHFSNLPEGSMVKQGDKLSFVVKRDPKNGKNMAGNVELVSSTTDTNTVLMRAFSMNLPFAALLANGYKTLETRNGTMFVPYPAGTKMLLHVGHRTYPDGNKHIDVMKTGGLSDEEIEELKILPRGFSTGAAVAIVEIGNTYETTVEERSDPEFQRSVAAFGSDSGKVVTEIRRVEYLKCPVNVSGQGGVFKVRVDPTVIPDKWDISAETTGMSGAQTGTLKSGKPVYSISG